MLNRILITAALACAAFGVSAQSLTSAQIAVLRPLVQAEPSLAQARQTGDDATIAAWLNAEAGPACVAWRSQYTPDLIRDAITNGITQLDGLTGSKRDALLWWAQGAHDARRAEVRAAIDDLTGTQNTLKSALQAGAKRNASRAEKALATGACSSAAPSITTFEGRVSSDDASAMR